MKPIKPLLLIAFLALFIAQAAAAQESNPDSYVERMGQKLAIGTSNVVTGIAELPKTIMITGREKGPAYAASAGFATGLLHMLGRTLFGTVDLVTFMVPTKPMIYPPYIWNDFNHETSYSFYPQKN